MSYEEETGTYSLYECIKLTEEKFNQLRLNYAMPEDEGFPGFLAAAKDGKLALPKARMILDLSHIVRQKQITGISRVEMELARQFLAMSEETGQEFVMTAFIGDAFQICEFASDPEKFFTSTGVPLIFHASDQFLLLSMRLDVVDKFFGEIYRAKRIGVVINFLIHDLIPAVQTAMVAESFSKGYLVGFSQILRFADRVITVSRKVARDFACYVQATSMVGLVPTRSLPIAHVALGCDAASRAGALAGPLSYEVCSSSLVAVGSFMQHKGIHDLVAAMEILWSEGRSEKLVLIGGDIGRGNTRAYLKTRPAFGHTLIIPGYVSDTELAHTMRNCGALVCASKDEGFGIPLVEAAALGCPIIARDTEIFRETSGGDAFFFDNGGIGEIAKGLRQWFSLDRRKQLKYVPKSSLVTWRQCAEMIKAIMFKKASSMSVDVGINATINLVVPAKSALEH